jgi:LPS-assembly lipoprotein
MNRRAFLAKSALTASIAASMAVLGGCGFRLRGSQNLPKLPAFTLEGDTLSDVAQSLQNALEATGTGVREDAAWRLTLSSPTLFERRLGADGRGSREHEFTLSTHVSLQQRSNNAYVLNSEPVSTSTRQRINDDDLLNRDVLISEVRRELSQQLAQQIIERLATLEVLRA